MLRVLKVGLLQMLGVLVLTAAPGAAWAAPGDATRGAISVVPSAEATPQKAEVYKASHALVIGIDQYSHLPRLSGAVRDARAMAAVLQARGFEVTLLIDKEATANTIRRILLGELPKKVGAEDRFLIYFAGHGVADGEGSQEAGFLMPVEAKEAWQGLDMVYLQGELRRRFKARHILYLADACYSGLGLSSRSVPKSSDLPGYLQRVAKAQVQLQFTAGGKGQQAHEYTGRRGTHGLFTYHLLDALDGAADTNGDKVITSAEIWPYLQQHVAATAAAEAWDQVPQYGREGEGEFLFFLGGGAPGAAAGAGQIHRASPKPAPPAPPAPKMTFAQKMFGFHPKNFETHVETWIGGGTAKFTGGKGAETATNNLGEMGQYNPSSGGMFELGISPHYGVAYGPALVIATGPLTGDKAGGYWFDIYASGGLAYPNLFFSPFLGYRVALSLVGLDPDNPLSETPHVFAMYVPHGIETGFDVGHLLGLRVTYFQALDGHVERRHISASVFVRGLLSKLQAEERRRLMRSR